MSSNEWYTPKEVFDALDFTFDLDPCSPGKDKCFVPAKKVYTKKDNGILKPWFGVVFMNPPFGGRPGYLLWLDQFFEHGQGVALVRADTSSYWWHRYIKPNAEYLLFPKGKTKFIRPDGSIVKQSGYNIALVGVGIGGSLLSRCDDDFGWLVDNRSRFQYV